MTYIGPKGPSLDYTLLMREQEFFAQMQARRSVSFERVVRPFVLIGPAAPVTSTPKRPLDGEDDEAFLRFGGPARFNRDALTDPLTTTDNLGGFRVQHDKDKKEKQQVTYTFRETNRKVEKIRIENPDDEDQYVIVERIKEITFQGPKGDLYKYILKKGNKGTEVDTDEEDEVTPEASA